MRNVFQNKTLLLNISALLIIFVMTGAFTYYRAKITDTCSKKLESYSENHLCISTSKGIMVFELYKDGGPNAITRMTKLANENKFYDGLEFYRVAKDFVLQAGIQDIKTKTNDINILDARLREKVEMLGKDNFAVETDFSELGLTDAQISALTETGYKSERSIQGRKFEYGSISFANNGSNGNSTEFFIISSKTANDENIANLNGRFTNFGKIIEGQSVLDSINNVPADTNYPIEFSPDRTKPAEKITIFEIRTK